MLIRVSIQRKSLAVLASGIFDCKDLWNFKDPSNVNKGTCEKLLHKEERRLTFLRAFEFLWLLEELYLHCKCHFFVLC